MIKDVNESQALTDVRGLVANIVCAFVTNNAVPLQHLPDLIATVHSAIRKTRTDVAKSAPVPLDPAVPIDKSVTKQFLFCLEDGHNFKSLKRHLATAHGLTPDAYRAKWKLPPNYPMVAKAYSAARLDLAKSIRLGIYAASRSTKSR